MVNHFVTEVRDTAHLSFQQYFNGATRLQFEDETFRCHMDTQAFRQPVKKSSPIIQQQHYRRVRVLLVPNTLILRLSADPLLEAKSFTATQRVFQYVCRSFHTSALNPNSLNWKISTLRFPITLHPTTLPFA